MKTSELRLGNFIDVAGYICNVIFLNESDIGFKSEDCEGFEMQLKGVQPDCEPIKLTEEWFLKFGFYKDEEFFSMHILDYKYCFKYADFRKDWGFYQEFTDSPYERDDGVKYFISCGMNYVHQLQNLYFSLLGEELIVKN